MRLFIALSFDEKTRERMLETQNRLRAQAKGNFSHAENLHLTLAFLGETEPGRLDEIRRVMDGLHFPLLRLSFDRLGIFSREGGNTWWLGLSENPELLALQGALSEGLREAGFPLERRRFSPHITLARQLRLTGPADKKKLFGASFSAETDRLSLLRSVRIDGRLQYPEEYAVFAKYDGPAQHG